MMIQTIIASKYMTELKLGFGAFGEVYSGKNLETNEGVAIKTELLEKSMGVLTNEAKLYKLLEGGAGIPKIYWHGEENEYYVMVMEKLGLDLEQLLKKCGGKLSLKTVLMIAEQILERIEYFHSKNYLHRDIKPENFLTGVGKSSSIVYLIDFGCAKRYRDPKSGEHIPYRDDKSLTGTARYVSENTHRGIEQSRRDDLEAALYVFVYLLKGSLPWQGLAASSKEEKYRKMMEKKAELSPKEICDGLPDEFARFLDYTKKLRFDERPDYLWLKKMLKELFFKMEKNWDFIYDWEIPSTGEKTETPTSHSNQEKGEGETQEEQKKPAIAPINFKINFSIPQIGGASLQLNGSTAPEKKLVFDPELIKSIFK